MEKGLIPLSDMAKAATIKKIYFFSTDTETCLIESVAQLRVVIANEFTSEAISYLVQIIAFEIASPRQGGDSQ